MAIRTFFRVIPVLLALLACGRAQQTISTIPAGYVTLTIPGTDTGGGSTTLSFKALGLVRPVEFEGTATAVTANTIACASAGWTDDQFDGANGAYYVEITGPTGTAGLGTTYDISATSAATQTITLAQPLAAGADNNLTFRIRKHWTLASVFGAQDESGLQGGFATTADLVTIYSGDAYHNYYYSQGGLAGVGWRLDTDDATDRSGLVLLAEEGLLIKRRQPGTLTMRLLGEVKTGQTSIPIFPGLNLLGNPYAAPMTLTSSNLYTGDPATGLAGGFASTADQVLIYNGASYDTYYYSTGGLSGTGWRRVNDDQTDRGSTPLPLGSAFLIRRVGSSALNWVVPSHPASQ